MRGSLTLLFATSFPTIVLAADVPPGGFSLTSEVDAPPPYVLTRDVEAIPAVITRLHMKQPEQGDTPGERALHFLARHPEWLGGVDPHEDLTLTLSRDLGDGVGLSFAQHRAGIPVDGRSVWVWVKADGRIGALRLTLAPRPASTVAQISRETAETLTRQVIPSPSLFSTLSSRQIFWSGPDRVPNQAPRLAWEVRPLPDVPLPLDLFVTIDAVTGEVLEWEDRTTSARQSLTFPTNPVVDNYQVSQVELPWVVDEATYLLGENVEGASCHDQHTLVPIESDYGPRDVHVCTFTRAATPDSGGNFMYPADDVQDWENLSNTDPFSEVSAFYHASVAADFFLEMGVTNPSTLPLQVMVNYQDPDGGNEDNMSDPHGYLLDLTNAFFTTGSVPGETTKHPPRLLFGQGVDADLAYDGDVVYHEFTHAMVNALDGPRRSFMDLYGFNGEGPAMNEGYADYFSCVITGDPDFAEYASYDPGEEEQHGWRNLVNDKNCHDNMNTTSHNDGMIWSGALWQVRSGRSLSDQREFDLGVLDGMAAAGAYADFEMAAAVTTTTVGARLGEDVADVLWSEFLRRYMDDCWQWLPQAGGPTSFSSKGKKSVQVSGPAPGSLQLFYTNTTVGGDLVVRGSQRLATGTRLHLGGYDKDPNEYMRLLVRKGGPVSFIKGLDTWYGVYDFDVPFLRTGVVDERDTNSYIQYEARIPVDETATWYVMPASNDGEGGSIFWLKFTEEERKWVVDTQGLPDEETPTPGDDGPGCRGDSQAETDPAGATTLVIGLWWLWKRRNSRR